MRHFKRGKEHKGQIGVLVNGNGIKNMSGPDLVHSNTIVCMNDNMTNLGQTKEQLDILSYLYPYHMAAHDNMRPSNCRNEKLSHERVSMLSNYSSVTAYQEVTVEDCPCGHCFLFF